jgi:hypothetical protein
MQKGHLCLIIIQAVHATDIHAGGNKLQIFIKLAEVTRQFTTKPAWEGQPSN